MTGDPRLSGPDKSVGGRVVLGGASGFMGRSLLTRLRARGREVVTVGRSGSDVGWDDPAALTAAVEGASHVIGLSGKSVDCRYTARNRAEIFRSRRETTERLREAIVLGRGRYSRCSRASRAWGSAARSWTAAGRRSPGAAAPHPVDNRALMRTIRQTLGIRVHFPMPRWMQELGAIGMRTETELTLKSRWVLPERFEAAGFEFAHPELEPAVRSLLRARR